MCELFCTKYREKIFSGVAKGHTVKEQLKLKKHAFLKGIFIQNFFLKFIDMEIGKFFKAPRKSTTQ